MLTKMEYDELVKFRNGPLQRLDGPTPMIPHLVDLEYLKVIETNVLPDLTLLSVAWQLKTEGEIALWEVEERSAQEEQRRAEQEAAEAKRLKERHEDHAREERFHRTQNKVEIAAAIIGACISFVLGMVVEHQASIITTILSWFH